jgi:hypothetical protein
MLQSKMAHIFFLGNPLSGESKSPHTIDGSHSGMVENDPDLSEGDNQLSSSLQSDMRDLSEMQSQILSLLRQVEKNTRPPDDDPGFDPDFAEEQGLM